MANYLWEVPGLQVEADNKHIPRNPEDEPDSILWESEKETTYN